MNIAMGTTPVIAIVVPCYNEEQALPLSVPKMLDVIDRMVADGIASAEKIGRASCRERVLRLV